MGGGTNVRAVEKYCMAYSAISLEPSGPLHPCPHAECSKVIPGPMWACAEHWHQLPVQIRQGIWSAYQEQGPWSLALASAKRRAFAFWDTPGDDRAIRPLAA